jgi:uncharacterized membrane protein
LIHTAELLFICLRKKTQYLLFAGLGLFLFNLAVLWFPGAAPAEGLLLFRQFTGTALSGFSGRREAGKCNVTGLPINE